ncbi:5'-nucleotidase / UDP-sugar diphosphatase [Desulfomicrobium norvegicum]|uniref:5'-nucleotidase / UDP-sugar diphosphatase n=1 Tax=Desulfomicrobium norvegicum (strain DSM 1741 / NCIMB 8310) TaxID=52561 RepID=A0A8G2F5Q7_DESNO|nr:bifunctional UDP-sugar hydrolase/5'-nucleotidase [Desulfomicrobium norvegicum]SFM09399.1 5'-nucleotidase / UDP-sugar diphosphatase [Desulfomicrobium norvegicum]
MRFHKMIRFIPVLAILLLCGCASLSHVGHTGPQALTILHTNDHHGRFWKNSAGEYGLAVRKTLADAVRAEVLARGGHVLLLDAGDVNTGVPESDMLDAEPDIRGMNAMGYDAMAVGNHEFDNPLAILRKQERWMDFPLLAANIYDSSGQRLFAPWHLFRLRGLTVAVFGLTTESTAIVGNPEHVKGLVFRPAIDEARELVPRLRNQADVVIALTHLGFDESEHPGVPQTGSRVLARAVPGIDLIVDGHSHTQLDDPVLESGTVIVQAGEYGKYLGRVDLLWTGRQVRLTGGALLPVNLTEKVDGQTVPPTVPLADDPAMLALLTPFQEEGGEALQTVIGHGNGNFTADRAVTRSSQTALGTLACRALMEKTGADAAVMNSGGLRAGLPSGPITYKDVLTVKPFGNTICTVDMTGAELDEYLRQAASFTPGSGAFAQFGGVRFVLRGGAVSDVFVGEKPLDAGRMYTVAMESYLAGGGDGYPAVKGLQGFVDTGFVDADALREYIARHSPLDPAEYDSGGAVLRE